MESQLAQLERDTGHQVAVLTISTLDGEDIEGFSIRVAENWKIGKKGFDNGVILVVAVKDRGFVSKSATVLKASCPMRSPNASPPTTSCHTSAHKITAAELSPASHAVEKILRKEPLPESARKKIKAAARATEFPRHARNHTWRSSDSWRFAAERIGNEAVMWGTRGRHRGPTIWGGPGGWGGGGFRWRRFWRWSIGHLQRRRRRLWRRRLIR